MDNSLDNLVQVASLRRTSTEGFIVGEATKRAQVGSSLAVVVVVCTLIGPPAAAEESNEPNDVAQLVELVAPDLGSVEQLESTETAFVSETASVPVDPDKPVVFDSDGSSGLEVSLPPEVQVGHGEMAGDGTVVYASDGNDVDVAAQVLENNTLRIQTIIGDPSAPHEFTYQLGNGYLPIRAADDSLWAYRFTKGGELELYGIGEAWARGADGRDVTTHYEIRGDAVTQIVVATNETVYPVVADPTWEWYSAAYGAGFSKAETRTLNSLGSIAGFCAALYRIGGGGLAAACGVAGAQWWAQAALAVNANGCVFIATVPAPLAMRWLSTRCR